MTTRFVVEMLLVWLVVDVVVLALVAAIMGGPAVRRRPEVCGVLSPPLQAGSPHYRRVRCALPAGHDAGWLSPPAPLHISADGIRFRTERMAYVR